MENKIVKKHRAAGKRAYSLEFDYNSVHYKGEGVPISEACSADVCYEVDITLTDAPSGIIRCAKAAAKWTARNKAQATLSATRYPSILNKPGCVTAYLLCS